MRVEYIGHAKLLFETTAGTLLTDPWFSEPAYANSLWHYPPMERDVEEFLDVDYLYVSHRHLDHFDPASLLKFPKDTPVIIARFPHNYLERDLKTLGFKHVIELLDWQKWRLDSHTSITMINTNYPGAEDCSIIVEEDGATVFNQNDNMMSTEKLAEIGNRFDIDIAFYMYAATGAYPGRFELPAEVIREEGAKKRLRFMEKAVEALKVLKPKQAVPFASDFGWFADDHLELNEINRTYPNDMADMVGREIPEIKSFYMNPLDVWTPEQGLTRNHDMSWEPEAVRHHIRKLAHERQPKIRELMAAEDRDTSDLSERFKDFFNNAVSITWDEAKEIGKFNVLMHAEGTTETSWTIDFSKESDWVSVGEPETWDMRVTVPDNLLMAFVEGELEFQAIWNARLKVSRPSGYSSPEQRFWKWLFHEVDSIASGREASPCVCALGDYVLSGNTDSKNVTAS